MYILTRLSKGLCGEMKIVLKRPFAFFLQVVDVSQYSNAEAWSVKCQALIPNYEKANGEGATVFGNMLKAKLATAT